MRPTSTLARNLYRALLIIGVFIWSPVHAAIFDTHWDGDWDQATGIINGTFVVETLPFPLTDIVSNLNTNQAVFSNGADSLHLSFVPGANPPPFGGFTAYQGTFTIDSGTSNYAGAIGGGNYIAYSIPDPNHPGFLKISVFDHGEINIVPEPSTYALLVAGVAALAFAMGGRRDRS